MTGSIMVGYQHSKGPCSFHPQGEAARSSKRLVSYHNTVSHHNPEDLNLNV